MLRVTYTRAYCCVTVGGLNGLATSWATLPHFPHHTNHKQHNRGFLYIPNWQRLAVSCRIVTSKKSISRDLEQSTCVLRRSRQDSSGVQLQSAVQNERNAPVCSLEDKRQLELVTAVGSADSIFFLSLTRSRESGHQAHTVSLDSPGPSVIVRRSRLLWRGLHDLPNCVIVGTDSLRLFYQGRPLLQLLRPTGGRMSSPQRLLYTRIGLRRYLNLDGLSQELFETKEKRHKHMIRSLPKIPILVDDQVPCSTICFSKYRVEDKNHICPLWNLCKLNNIATSILDTLGPHLPAVAEMTIRIF
ncbi:hypothetical protein J6590_031016 [Homalodisca vitripennis]|nr:hypothetical protein J6590_031016 [Homalodisca vitripennis]